MLCSCVPEVPLRLHYNQAARARTEIWVWGHGQSGACCARPFLPAVVLSSVITNMFSGLAFAHASPRHPSTGTSVSCDDVEKQSGLFPISTNVHHPKAKLHATLPVASFFAQAWPERRSSTVHEPSPGAKSLEELRAPSHQVLSPPKRPNLESRCRSVASVGLSESDRSRRRCYSPSLRRCCWRG